MTTLLLAGLAVACGLATLGDAEEPIASTAVVPAPIEEVWRAWTTNDGISSWMVAKGTVDFRIGGKYRTSYKADSDLTGPDVIENLILAYDPMRMITIRNVTAPDGFPFKTAMAKAWTVIYFESVDAKHTRVRAYMNGFDSTEESQKMKGFFKTGNQQTMDALVKRFTPKS